MIKILPLIALWLTLCGCLTPNQTSFLAGIGRSAAYLGTRERLRVHPEEWPTFVAVKEGLAGLLRNADYDPSNFANALQMLKVKELKGDKGMIIVSTIVSLLDTYGTQLTDLDKTEKVKPIMVAVYAGFQEALADLNIVPLPIP